MKQLKLLACAMALAALAMFTGCGGDDDNGGSPSPAPSTGTNAPAHDALIGKTITLDNGDTITLSTASDYSASFAGAGESGTYTYTPSGDNAALVLTPTEGAGSNYTLTFNADQVSGTFSLAEPAQSGSFTVQ